MKAVSQPGEQTGLGARKIDAGHANLGKSKLARPVPHSGQQERNVALTAVEHHAPIVGSPASQQTWRSEDDTRVFAQALARRPALVQAFIALHGDLGAGKTTLVRHLLRALGVEGRIKSPTYAVVEPYELADCPAWHFDFYRFDDEREWEDAGFRDIFAGPGLKLAEWPEKAGTLLPLADLDVHIALRDDGGRDVRLQPNTPRGRDLLA